jgi:hypothetical protein
MNQIDFFDKWGFPLYIRKIDKRSAWTPEVMAEEDRPLEAANRGFPRSEKKFSLYLVSTFDELKRVTVGLNSFRRRLKEQVDFIAFTRDELDGIQACLLDAVGATGCDTANRLHVDIQIADYAKCVELCEEVMGRERTSFRVSKKDAKSWANELELFGCLAFQNNQNCPCEI